MDRAWEYFSLRKTQMNFIKTTRKKNILHKKIENHKNKTGSAFFSFPTNTWKKSFLSKYSEMFFCSPKKFLYWLWTKIKKTTLSSNHMMCAYLNYTYWNKENNIYKFFACVPCLSIFFSTIYNANMYISVIQRKKNKNSFYNKNSILLNRKKIYVYNFFWPRRSVFTHRQYNFFLSFAPLFISDRLKKQFMVHLVCSLRTQ